MADWRGPLFPGEFPTLGFLTTAWIEAHCVIPDGDHMGEPYLLTDEQARFLVFHYRLRPDTGRFHYRRSQLVRPQKWGKGPLTGAMICVEAVGPVRFAGWAEPGEQYRCSDYGCGCGFVFDYEPGDPTGAPWPTPWIQVTAVSGDQTANVYRALVPMIELGPLSALIPDTGETRINLPGGGRIEPVTASAKSRLGQRITFAVQDETHSWLEANGGWTLADNQRRNLAGMGGRSVETTNAWNPAEMSVGQATGESKAADVYRDMTQAPDVSLANKRELRRALKAVYGDSWWIDLDRLVAEIEELVERGEEAQAKRFFLNRVETSSDAWMDGDRWDARAVTRNEPPDGTALCLGFDGSDADDFTVIRAETLDGYQFTPHFRSTGKAMVWNPREHGGFTPRLEVEAAVEELFERYDVRRMYCDPPYWQTEVDTWAGRYGEKRVIRWATYRVKQMSDALERLRTDVYTTDSGLTHDGCEITAQHVRNAVMTHRASGVLIQKDRPQSPRKIDAAVTSALAHEAVGDETAKGSEGPSYAYFV